MNDTKKAPDGGPVPTKKLTREERLAKQVASIPGRFHIKSVKDAEELARRYVLEETGETDDGSEATVELVLRPEFRIEDLEDGERVEAVTEAWRTMRDNRLGITKVKKVLKSEVLAVGKAIDGHERAVIENLKPTEELLKAELDRVKAEKERKKQELIEDRLGQLAAYGSNLTAGVVGGLTDKRFEEVLADAKEQHEAALEEERQRKEAEEARQRELEAERERQRKEAEELRLERERQDAERAEIEREREELRKEREAQQRAKDEEERAAEERQARAQAESDAEAQAAVEENTAASEDPAPVVELEEPEAPLTSSEPVELEADADADAEVRGDGLPADGSWVWSESDEHFQATDGFDSEADALEDAMVETDGDAVYVGRVQRLSAADVMRGTVGGWALSSMGYLLEAVSEAAFDEVGDQPCEGWPHLSEGARAALVDDLTALALKHAQGPEWEPNFYRVSGLRRVELPGGEG